VLGEGCVLGGVCAGAGAGLGVLGEGCVRKALNNKFTPKGTPGVRSAQSRKTRFLFSCIARLVYLDTRVIGQSALPGEQSPPASSTRPGTTPTLHVLSAHKTASSNHYTFRAALIA